MARSRKKNPDVPIKYKAKKNGKSSASLPWIGALAGAALAGFGAYKLLKTDAPPPPPPQQQAPPQAQPQVHSPLQGMGRPDEHGIPWVALPGESAARTMQARRVAPQRLPQQGMPSTAPQATPQGETFGGNDGASMGGERF